MKVKNYSTDANEIRLIKYHKKGLLRLIFSRLGLIIVLLAFQIAIFVTLMLWLAAGFKYYTILMGVFTTIMVFYLYNCDMDSSAKLTWMIIIAIFPIPGALFLAFTQVEIGHRALKRRMLFIMSETRNSLRQDKEVIRELIEDANGQEDLHRYINRTGCFPIYKNSEVTYFPWGQDKYEVMMEEIEKAEKFIFLEYFIIEEGYMWGRLLKLLVEKAKQGVDVRVLYDGMCEMQLLPHNYTKRLAEYGIKARTFSTIHPFVSTYYNYRDHRKVLVIDGKVAFNGGVNLADEYINKVERFGVWKDTAVMVKGDAVKAYTLMFLQMWSADDRELRIDEYLNLPIDNSQFKDVKGYVMPYSDIPLDDEKVGENVYMDVINRADKYVHIMTPYLILDDELKNAIRYAAERGVEVDIILPGIPDKKMAFALAKTHYLSLIKAGVNIYEYTPGFVHAKVFTSDDTKAIVGTINLDYRSLYHHFECATYMYKVDAVSEIEADYQKTLQDSHKITMDDVKHEKLFYKIAGGVVKLVAPLM